MYLSKDLVIAVMATIAAIGISFTEPYVSITVLTLVVGSLLFVAYKKRTDSQSLSVPVSDYRVADTVMLINSQGLILDCNHQVFPMFGYTAEETIGKPIEFLMDPSLQSEHVSLRDRFFITSGQRRMQNRVWGVHKEGHRVHIEVHLEISSIGSQANVICSIRNVEAFWLREKELVLENQILKASQEGFIGLVHSTLGGQILLANNFLSNLLGYSTDEFKSMSIHDLVHDSHLEALSAAELMLIDGRSMNQSLNLLLLNNRGHSVAAKLMLALVETKKEHFISWTITDRTTEIALERQVKRLNSELEALINSVPGKTAIWVSTPGMSNLIRTNEIFTHIWGCSSDELQTNPRAFLTKIHSTDQSRAMEVYQGHLRSGWHQEYKMTSESGMDFQVTETAKLIPDEHDVGYLVCFQQFNPL